MPEHLHFQLVSWSTCFHFIPSPELAFQLVRKRKRCVMIFVLDVQELVRTVLDFLGLSVGIRIIWEQHFGEWRKVLWDTICSLVIEKCARCSEQFRMSLRLLQDSLSVKYSFFSPCFFWALLSQGCLCKSHAVFFYAIKVTETCKLANTSPIFPPAYHLLVPHLENSPISIYFF